MDAKVVYIVGQCMQWGKSNEFVCETLADVAAFFRKFRPTQDLTHLIKDLESGTRFVMSQQRGSFDPDPVFALGVNLFEDHDSVETKGAPKDVDEPNATKKRLSRPKSPERVNLAQVLNNDAKKQKSE